MATKYLMQGKSTVAGLVPLGALFTWLSDLPDWTGTYAEILGTSIPVTDIALAGGGIESSVPDGVMVFDDGSYVVFDDGSYVS